MFELILENEWVAEGEKVPITKIAIAGFNEYNPLLPLKNSQK